MRGVALALLAGFLAPPAFGQVAVAKAPSPHASLCEIAKHPEQFEGKSVKIHARYSVNWEWGAWVWDEHCGWGLGLVLANGYPTPAYLSGLYVERDSAFDAFQQKEKLLCSVDVLCEFDFLEADFTGIVVGDNHFPHRPLNDAVLVVTSIAAPKLHRDEHPMGTRNPPLPSTIPEPEHR